MCVRLPATCGPSIPRPSVASTNEEAPGLVAIPRGTQADELIESLDGADVRLMSTATLVELGIVMEAPRPGRRGRRRTIRS